MNKNFTASDSLYYFQKGLDRTSILGNPLRHAGGGLGCKGMSYIRKGTPQKKGMDIFQCKRNKWESIEYPVKKYHHNVINPSLDLPEEVFSWNPCFIYFHFSYKLC